MFLQHQAALKAAAVGLLFRNLQDQFFGMRGQPPDEPRPLAAGAGVSTVL
jgi:hypothetical protein